MKFGMYGLDEETYRMIRRKKAYHLQQDAMREQEFFDRRDFDDYDIQDYSDEEEFADEWGDDFDSRAEAMEYYEDNF